MRPAWRGLPSPACEPVSWSVSDTAGDSARLEAAAAEIVLKPGTMVDRHRNARPSRHFEIVSGETGNHPRN